MLPWRCLGITKFLRFIPTFRIVGKMPVQQFGMSWDETVSRSTSDDQDGGRNFFQSTSDDCPGEMMGRKPLSDQRNSSQAGIPFGCNLFQDLIVHLLTKLDW